MSNREDDVHVETYAGSIEFVLDRLHRLVYSKRNENNGNTLIGISRRWRSQGASRESVRR